MLGNGVLNYIRKMTKQTLTARCTIQTEAAGTGTFGQPLEGWEDVAADVPCRVIKAAASAQDESEQFASQDAINEQYRLIVAYDVALDTSMRVIVDGTTYYVVQLETGLTDRVFRSAVVMRKAGADG